MNSTSCKILLTTKSSPTYPILAMFVNGNTKMRIGTVKTAIGDDGEVALATIIIGSLISVSCLVYGTY